MNVVYLSPHFPPNFQAFCLRLREFGANVLGLGDAPYESLGWPLQQALNDYYRVDDLHHYDQLVRALGYFIHRHGKLDRIDSHAEYWLETEARLRTDFNIWGVKNDAIQAIKLKSHMKAVFRQAGVPVARGATCRTLAQALDLIDATGFPVVAKPDVGVGAAATYKLHSREELQAFYETKPPIDYFLEEFVSGDIYSFDGLTDRDGQLRFFTAHRYSQGIMETVNRDDHIYYHSLRDIPQDLEEAGRRILKAFDVRERFFHFEFFRTHGDGRLVALEVNMRPPGGWTTDMFNVANDFDIYREWANLVVNNRFDATWSRPYHAVYISRKHHIHYVHSHDEILRRYAPYICKHEPMPAVFSGALGHYGYIARSPELDDVLAIAAFIQQTHA